MLFTSCDTPDTVLARVEIVVQTPIMITILASRHVASYPPREGKLSPAGHTGDTKELLSLHYESDAHFAAYVCESAPGRRLRTESIDHGCHPTMHALVLDIDGPGKNLPPAEIELWQNSTLERVANLEEDWGISYIQYRTRNGLRVIWQLAEPPTLTTRAECKQWSDWYLERVDEAASYGIHVDPACKDWTRLFRVPYCMREIHGTPTRQDGRMEFCVEHDAFEYAPPAIPPTLESATGTDVSEFCTEWAPLYAPEGNRHEYRLAAMGWLLRIGVPDADVKTLLDGVGELVGAEPARIDDIIQTRRKLETDSPTTGFNRMVELSSQPDMVGSPAECLEAVKAAYTKLENDHLKPNLERDKNGVVRASLLNATRILRKDYNFAGALVYDEARGQASWNRPVPVENNTLEGAIRKTDATDVACWIAANYGTPISRETAQHAIEKVARERSFHPAHEYLNRLQWDPSMGSLIDQMLNKVFQPTDPAEYVRLVSRRFMISLVARMLQPGCQVDNMLIVEGEQGLGKSTFFQRLLPDPAWYTDSISAGLPEKQLYEATAGKFLCESSELVGTKQSTSAQFKAFLSSRAGQFRAAYDTHGETRNRQFVIAGTTNESEYLLDRTGARRFWPITSELTERNRIDTRWVVRNRDLLFAEAAYYARKGLDLNREAYAVPADTRWWFEGDEIAMQAEAAERRRVVYTDEDVLLEAMARFSTEERYVQHASMLQIETEAELIYPRYRMHQQAAADVLRRNGYEQKRTRNARLWVHYKHREMPVLANRAGLKVVK